MNFDAFPQIQKILRAKFLEKTAEEWEKHMESFDTCIIAVRRSTNEPDNFLHPSLIRPKF